MVQGGQYFCCGQMKLHLPRTWLCAPTSYINQVSLQLLQSTSFSIVIHECELNKHTYYVKHNTGFILIHVVP
jgi:hypothetical protein